LRNSAWAYLAVSSSPQETMLEEDQLAWARDEAERQGWTITHVVRGVGSGKLGPRAMARELLVQLRALDPEQRPDYVLITRIDRVGRGAIVETQLVFHELRELGVRAYTREDGEVRSDTPLEQLMVAMKATLAAQENEVRRDKALATYRRRAAAGRTVGNKRPYGLKSVDGVDVPDERYADVVREVFRLRLQGFGYFAIARRMLAFAPATREWANGKSSVIRWTQNRVKRLLETKLYAGVLIDEVTFERARRITAELTRPADPTSRNKNEWPLSGSIRCYCGRAMVGKASGPARHRYRYYVCHATWAHPKLRMVRADRIEPQFVELLRELRARPSLVADARRSAVATSPKMLQRALREAAAVLADVSARRAKIWAAIESDELRGPEAQGRLDELTADRDAAEARLAELERERAYATTMEARTADAAAILAEAAGLYDAALESERRQLARVVAIELGGLWVDEDEQLQIGRRIDPAASRRRKTREA
jgi:DNA invertase Pin-like site-specific DNA recombinase